MMSSFSSFYTGTYLVNAYLVNTGRAADTYSLVRHWLTVHVTAGAWNVVCRRSFYEEL